MTTTPVGSFLSLRKRDWIVEAVEEGSAGRKPTRHSLVCVDDDAQGDVFDAVLEAEIAVPRIEVDPWRRLVATSLEDPLALGAHLRATGWQTASAADRRLFQAPFRAGIRLDAYQLLPLKKALSLPRVNLLIADDVGLGKTVEAGLVARELLLRRRVDVLVVAAPASMLLRMSWRKSLASTLLSSIVSISYRRGAQGGLQQIPGLWAPGSSSLIAFWRKRLT